MLLLYFAIAFIQISPGELSNAHKELEGLANCFRCHSVGKKVDIEKCLTCHGEIKELIENAHGFHYYVRYKNCTECHREHFGRNFKIVKFDKDSFNHSNTGFPLLGIHAKLQCSECHNLKFILNEKFKSKETYLGLNSKCISCHKDEHRGQLNQDCTVCHSFNDWTDARAKFDHNKSRFKLEGAHKNVDCYSCHKKRYDATSRSNYIVFKNIEFSSCSSCHIDFHKGKFGKCESCHSTSGWRFIKVKFNHNLTEYKLEGKHENLNCNKCHNRVKSVKTENDYMLNFKIKYELCTDCHEDYHKGAFSGRKDNDCKFCHSVYGFIPVFFTIERHNRETRFILAEAHSTLPCSDCHISNGKEKFHWDELICQSCHVDNHGGQFSNTRGRTLCEKCHKTTIWKDLKFEHNETRFKLIGKHSKVKCDECHNQKINIDGKTIVKYKGTPMECFSCHRDIHLGQFADSNGFVKCDRCHNSYGWKELIFDHNRDSKFKLTGAHENVACLKCHRLESSVKGEFVRFKPTPTRCEDCHGS